MILPNFAKMNKITKKLFYFALTTNIRHYYQYYSRAFHPRLAYRENISAQLQNGVVAAMLFCSALFILYEPLWLIHTYKQFFRISRRPYC